MAQCKKPNRSPTNLTSQKDGVPAFVDSLLMDLSLVNKWKNEYGTRRELKSQDKT
jgi:hypothetical protein